MRILEVEADNFKLFTTKFQAIKDLGKADVVLFNGSRLEKIQQGKVKF